MFDEIVDKVSVDYGQNEIQDIKKAVHTILDRLVDRVNERGVFKISRLEPCGSMEEHTAIWKIDRRTGDVFTEFDFLPVLKLPVDAKMVKSECGMCFEIRTLPIDVEVMKRRVEENGLSSKGLTTMRKKLDHLFWREVNTCLVSACDCFTVEFDDKVSWDRVSYQMSLQNKACGMCIVEMPTGVLSVNPSLIVDRGRQILGAKDCSLTLLWTSKARTIPSYSDLLQDPVAVKSLPIHVDLLPAIELLSYKQRKNSKHVHDCFLVPKHCVVCGGEEEWRKSSCKPEIAHIAKGMSKTHKKCFKIMKYILSVVDKHSLFINWYHVKTVVMNHSKKCVDKSKTCAECVMKMLTELRDVYETKQLKSFHLGVDIFDMFKYRHEKYAMIIKLCIGRLYSVTEKGTCATFVTKLQKAMEHEWVPEGQVNY